MRASAKAQAAVLTPSRTLLTLLRAQAQSSSVSSTPGFFDSAPSSTPRRRIDTPNTAIPATRLSGFLDFDFLVPRGWRRRDTKALSAARATYPKLSDVTTFRQTSLPKAQERNVRGIGNWRGGKLDEPPKQATPSELFPSRTAQKRASNDLVMRCTEFDETGNVVLVNGEFKKTELIQKYGLLPRDLRKIDSSTLPNILVRKSAILINLLHLRVLIKHNRVLVFDAYGSTDSYTQSVFMYDLEGKLRQKENSRAAGGLPYEFRALEAVLISATSSLETEFESIRDPIVRVLQGLEEDIDRDRLRHLLIYSKMLGTFEQKAKLVRDAIDEVLEADDDLAEMYLSEKARGVFRGEEDDHNEVEMLLESYHKLCNEIVQASSNLVNNIRNTEEVVRAILDSNRNALMLLDLKFSIGTLGIGTGAFICSMYGMNLVNYLEQAQLGFVGISGASFFFAGLICTYGLHKLRKVQKVSMYSEHGRFNEGGRSPIRGAWNRLERPSADDMLRRERMESKWKGVLTGDRATFGQGNAGGDWEQAVEDAIGEVASKKVKALAAAAVANEAMKAKMAATAAGQPDAPPTTVVMEKVVSKEKKPGLGTGSLRMTDTPKEKTVKDGSEPV